jgi:hypothetical protein
VTRGARLKSKIQNPKSKIQNPKSKIQNPTMQTHKHQKLDLTLDYPCPCRRRGRLIPITLTEAYGCDRCQQIFVTQENSPVIEQLSTTYPYKRAWRWNGHQWNIVNPNANANYLPLTLMIIFVLLFLLLLTVLQSPLNASTLFRVGVALMMSMMLVFVLWLACRR